MKYVPVRIKKPKRKFFTEIRQFLPKPKIPLNMIWKINKVKNIYLE
jgi:hypothetical protein